MNPLVLLVAVQVLLVQRGQAHYTRQWAVEVHGGPDVADQVARDHGFVNLGQVRIPFQKC